MATSMTMAPTLRRVGYDRPPSRMGARTAVRPILLAGTSGMFIWPQIARTGQRFRVS